MQNNEKPFACPARLTLALVLGASLMLSACAIGPDYARPQTGLPERYVTEEAGNLTTDAPINPEWWTLFGDAELNQLVDQALAQNQDLQAAIARMEAAEAAAREAGADYFPTVDLQGASIRTRTSGETASGKQMGVMTSTNRRVALNIGYEFDIWGRLRRSNEAARADALSGRFARDVLQLSLIAQVVSVYLDLRVRDVETLTMSRNLRAQAKTRDIVQGRRDVGAASDLEVAQVVAAHAATSARLSEILRQRTLTENLLGLLVGQPGLRFEPLAETAVPLSPLPPVGLPSALIEARPDVRQAEEALVAANARIGLAKAAYFPVIGLTGFFGSESAQLADLFTRPAEIWSYGASITAPIFNWGRTSARVDQASAWQREALANYQKTVQGAFREVRDALASLSLFDRTEGELLTQLSAAGDALKLSTARYEVGYSGFLEVLDSQRTLNDAQLQYLAARRNRLLSAVDLFKALGGGWQEAEGGGETETGSENDETEASAPPPEPDEAPTDATADS
ncbi:MAG: efflux transporter outer membrane subunit [Zoogloeaceae bacterium]|jgi:multidrug efflux system outer membrane protein|nr:efflux transporter outer membrane subunit [Zoogloeaceae bacterium]